jgi:ribosomal protein S6
LRYGGGRICAELFFINYTFYHGLRLRNYEIRHKRKAFYVGSHIKTIINMTPEISTILYISSTLVAAATYYLTFRYQAKKIDILEKAIKTQSTLLDDFDKF